MFSKNKIIKYRDKNKTKPNKLMGQNFLRDKNILNKIIAAANLTAGDSVLEVGPGEGVLTRELARYTGRVIAVEKDKNLAARLKEEFKNNKNVEIIESDILEFLKTANYQLPAAYKVVANIPYYLTSHLIRLLLESENPPTEIVLLIQKEVAERICASPPEMSLLAVSVQFYAEPKIIASVSKRAFWPQPKVNSAIIRITPHQWCHSRPVSQYGVNSSGDPGPGSRVPPSPTATDGRSKPGMTKIEEDDFFRVARAGFSHPRKQLLGNLSGGLRMEKDKIIGALQTAGLKPQQRAETLSVKDWIKLAASL
ncbi:MAG: 16S rRNA (adenine(1518)-N(6)/adenine(1519)-N(6))-dimethyltransferase RsmA [Candidatus Portnoybacteria bacterium]|nr:16S rRNA (adenine(1518)-N(6)/adenine(1519)-N(6))-dimethyltransferase RsmA [Candidatus Portnoybacteria bacterium]MDD4982733.1 16S rRNA (adenine(1518)-N(6)/adenine(1519)-N(6))-dimethyltransferase RsmA [Candidatus Portnoybacteria bacterium]